MKKALLVVTALAIAVAVMGLKCEKLESVTLSLTPDQAEFIVGDTIIDTLMFKAVTIPAEVDKVTLTGFAEDKATTYDSENEEYTCEWVPEVADTGSYEIKATAEFGEESLESEVVSFTVVKVAEE